MILKVTASSSWDIETMEDTFPAIKALHVSFYFVKFAKNLTMCTPAGNPRKKRRVYVNREPPFPVPIATITGETASDKTWFYYTGELHGNHVVVKHSGDIDFLYKMGFFGKGSLSKSKPDFDYRRKTVDIPGTPGETTKAKLAKRRSYIRHMKWKRLEIKVAGGQTSVDDLIEYDSSLDLADEEMDTEGEHVINDKETYLQSSPLSNEPIEAATWEDTNEEFWTSPGDNQERNSQSSDMKDWAETDEDFWGSAPTGLSEKTPNDYRNKVKVVDVNVMVMENESRSCDDNNITVESESKFCDSEISAETEARLSSNNSTGLKNENTVPIINEINENRFDPSTLDRQKQFKGNNSCRSSHEHSDQSNVDSCQCDTGEVKICTPTHDVPEILEKGLEKESKFVLDSLCEEDEGEGDVLVIEDSDSETEGRYKKILKRWLPVLKKDAYHVKEFLHLSLEEAFFLSFGLGCLIVRDNGKTLDLHSMWTKFCDAQANFLPNYVVYHYFRSLGWVPKSGLKFGTDFILYKVGPPFYHGSYSVVVKMINQEDAPEVNGVRGRDFSWITLAGLNRITEHVAKELMLCYVIKPSSLTAEELQSPRCLSKFKVQIIVNRWIPSQERQEKVVEEMP
ncbi:tRNA-splicing endonuclease subunit Sen2-like isoform X2 [Ylistrum balloti]|uniref:tRNA-splicing endonuclease subunit Sen2-like isoform X2 n=1 Tax=Ylistrum balloti TaxID=509963 RepID=UPI0029059307|nr:tRNA-splicing endonuclease subunit Sen2-like isoform X2 [Ylistrum balloti]